MKLNDLIDQWLDFGVVEEGWTPRTVESYRACLWQLAEDTSNRDPRYIGRDELRRFLTRWQNRNTRHNKLSILRSFFDWLVEEGIASTNPARQVRPPKRRKPAVYKMRRRDVVALMGACRTLREKLVIYLGVCGGLRRQELLGIQGRHLQYHRDFVLISTDIAKGGRQRIVPILPELRRVLNEMAELESDDYVLCKQRWRDVGRNTKRMDYRKAPASPQAIYRLVKRVAERAGLSEEIGPHTLRHAYGDFVAKACGVKIAQALLGHADLQTTDIYLSEPSPDDLAEAVAGLTWEGAELREVPPLGVVENRTDVLLFEKQPANPLEATTGIEPVDRAPRSVEANLAKWLESQTEKIALYVAHFGGLVR